MSNPDHKGLHCAGLCEGAAYNAMLREANARADKLEADLEEMAKLLQKYEGTIPTIQKLEADKAALLEHLTKIVEANKKLTDAKAKEMGFHEYGSIVNALNRIIKAAADHIREKG